MLVIAHIGDRGDIQVSGFPDDPRFALYKDNKYKALRSIRAEQVDAAEPVSRGVLAPLRSRIRGVEA